MKSLGKKIIAAVVLTPVMILGMYLFCWSIVNGLARKCYLIAEEAGGNMELGISASGYADTIAYFPNGRKTTSWPYSKWAEKAIPELRDAESKQEEVSEALKALDAKRYDEGISLLEEKLQQGSVHKSVVEFQLARAIVERASGETDSLDGRVGLLVGETSALNQRASLERAVGILRGAAGSDAGWAGHLWLARAYALKKDHGAAVGEFDAAVADLKSEIGYRYVKTFFSLPKSIDDYHKLLAGILKSIYTEKAEALDKQGDREEAARSLYMIAETYTHFYDDREIYKALEAVAEKYPGTESGMKAKSRLE